MAGQLLRASASLTAFLCCAGVQLCLASLLVLVDHGPETVQEMVQNVAEVFTNIILNRRKRIFFFIYPIVLRFIAFMNKC